MFAAGCDELAISWLVDGFGPMADSHPGTLWERWDPSTSLCQGTGVGPAFLLCRYIAGVYPLEPGFRVIGIDPHPGRLPGMQARIHTIAGIAEIAWRQDVDVLHYSLRLPHELRGNKMLVAERVREAVRLTLVD